MKLFNGRVSKPECGCVHVTSKRIEELEKQELGYIQSLRELEAENAKLLEQHNDLIMQVQQKHPDETRHETARRYIYNAEHQDNPPASAELEVEK